MNDYPICKLCGKPANQTGSHIITAWLISHVFDEDNRNRNHEIMFNTASLGQNEPPYFGRGVKPETIQSIIGRDLDEEEIESQRNEIVKDYLFCSVCEKRFQIIEDLFLKVHRKILEEESENSINFVSNDNNVTRLFFYIQFWRMSILNDKFKLDLAFQNKIGHLLNAILTTDKTTTIDNINIHLSSIIEIPLMVVKITKEENPTSKILFFNHTVERPYFAIIADYIVCLYGKLKETRSPKHAMMGLTQYIESNWLSCNESSFIIGFLNLSKYLTIKERYMKLVITGKIEFQKKKFRKTFKRYMDQKPSEEIVSLFMRLLAKDEANSREWFTQQNFRRAYDECIAIIMR